MKILSVETSCDETAVCLAEAEGDVGADFRFKVLGNGLASQAAKHAEYGGVFPNLAKREHGRNLVPMLELALKESEACKKGLTMSFLEHALLKDILAREPELLEQLIPFLERCAKPDIDVIAVTYGPGLGPCLWVGVNFARALSVVWNIPVVAVNHMEGHIIVSLAEDGHLAPLEFPAIALLISGGHTELLLIRKWMQYEYIGKTRDDAVGEAFDKVARMLGLPYPGGPHISRLAEEARDKKLKADFKLPRPMLHASSAKGSGGPRENNYDFSFAGLKTAVLRIVEAEKNPSDNFKKAMAREFEDAAADVLVSKTLRAVEQYSAQTVIVGGGVSANTHIKAELKKGADESGVQLRVSPPELATDNAIMIALAGYFHALKKEFVEPDSLRPDADLTLSNID